MGVITALGELLSPQYLLMMIAGTMGGIMIGAMPGLTSVMGVTLLLPFTYGMDPAAGISILLAISFGAIYGGSITAILIGTPGTPASAATMIEGRQFTARGEGGGRCPCQSHMKMCVKNGKAASSQPEPPPSHWACRTVHS